MIQTLDAPTDKGSDAATRHGIQVHIHHLSLTLIHAGNRDIKSDVLAIEQLLCTRLFQRVPDVQLAWTMGPPRNMYRKSLFGPCGASILYEPSGPEKSGRDHFQLNLPGGFLESLSWGQLGSLVDTLANQFDPRCTRMDIAFDDCPFTVGQVLRAIQAGNVRTDVRRQVKPDGLTVLPYESRLSYSEGVPCRTVYLGSPASSRRLRVYDGRGFTRTELILRDDQADRSFSRLILNPTARPTFALSAMGLLRAFADFVDRPARRKGHRCPLLPWWKKMVGTMPILRLQPPPKHSEAGGQMVWLMQVVAPTLAAVANTTRDPQKFLIDLYVTGLEGMRQKHWQMIAKSGRSPRNIWRPIGNLFEGESGQGPARDVTSRIEDEE